MNTTGFFSIKLKSSLKSVSIKKALSNRGDYDYCRVLEYTPLLSEVLSLDAYGCVLYNGNPIPTLAAPKKCSSVFWPGIEKQSCLYKRWTTTKECCATKKKLSLPRPQNVNCMHATSTRNLGIYWRAFFLIAQAREGDKFKIKINHFPSHFDSRDERDHHYLYFVREF